MFYFNKIFLSIFISTFIFCFSIAIAEETIPVIYAIRIVGNRVTSEELIRREMILEKGMLATPTALERDRLRLEATGLFNRVQMLIIADESRAVLQVKVTEPFYVFPFLIFYWQPRSPDNSIYGMGVYHINLRGRGERLGFLSWTGYEKGLNLKHQDPWFSIGGKYGVEALASYSDSDLSTKSGETVRRESIGFNLGLVRRLGYLKSFELGGVWRTISSEARGYTLTPGWRDRIVGLRSIFKWDVRDFRYYASTGYYIWVMLEADRLIDLPSNYYRQWVDLRVYRKIGRFIIAGRTYGEMTQNTLPVYHWLELAHSVLRAGDARPKPRGLLASGSMELRFTMLKKRYYSFGSIPLAGPYLLNLKFSLEGLFFIDRGIYATRRSGVVENYRAYGTGIQMQLPYINIIHLIAGWTPEDSFNNPTFTFSTGVTF